jgi:hypothetical protein
VFEKFQNRRSFSYEGSYKIENKTSAESRSPGFRKTQITGREQVFQARFFDWLFDVLTTAIWGQTQFFDFWRTAKSRLSAHFSKGSTQGDQIEE